AGYRFDGWKSADVEIAGSKFTMPAKDVVLTGSWQTITYKITYNLNGGRADGAKDSYNVKESFTLPTPVKDGYTFIGWTGTDLTEPTLNVTVSGGIGDRTYTANWAATTYTATFNANGGTVDPASKSYTIEGKLELPTPAYAGHNFGGWKVTTADGNWVADSVHTGTVVAGYYGNVIFTAQWGEDSVTLTYTAGENGLVKYAEDEPSASVSETITAVTGEPKGVTAVPNDGYEFAGWYRNDNMVSDDPTLVPQKNETTGLYETAGYEAKFTRMTGSLTLDHSGSAPAVVTVTGQGLDITLVLNGDMTIPDLPTGSYTVTASGASATTTVSVNNEKPVVENKKNETVSITVSQKTVSWFTAFDRVVNKYGNR
ncbi:MAG: InlB B-repeat-containing protein, partial [Clostridia bacterium]|nr:InlB B-repeat-containing protein [Clostridia bacterium]